MNKKNLHLEAPWTRYGKYLHALFERDPEITVGDVEELETPAGEYRVTLTVPGNLTKLAVLRCLLPRTVDFGNVRLVVRVLDGNGDEMDLNLFAALFHGNPIFRDVREVVDPAGGRWGYVRFAPEVVQFPDDNLADFSGNWSGLAQDIAEEVFRPTEPQAGLHFCTADLRENEVPDHG